MYIHTYIHTYISIKLSPSDRPAAAFFAVGPSASCDTRSATRHSCSLHTYTYTYIHNIFTYALHTYIYACKNYIHTYITYLLFITYIHTYTSKEICSLCFSRALFGITSGIANAAIASITAAVGAGGFVFLVSIR